MVQAWPSSYCQLVLLVGFALTAPLGGLARSALARSTFFLLRHVWTRRARFPMGPIPRAKLRSAVATRERERVLPLDVEQRKMVAETVLLDLFGAQRALLCPVARVRCPPRAVMCSEVRPHAGRLAFSQKDPAAVQGTRHHLRLSRAVWINFVYDGFGAWLDARCLYP